MLDILLLRLDAPLMSFGKTVVDNRGVVQDHPTLSGLTGLLANALGYVHADAARLQRLQRRLRFAARADRRGSRLMDFQTVDLGQPYMAGGWTTRGAAEERGGGSARSATHIRLREYLADAVFTVALTLVPHAEEPTVSDLGRALGEPARPLFIGRKCCLPSAPLLLGHTCAQSLLDALRGAPPLAGERATPDEDGALAAWWPDGEPGPDGVALLVVDERDWSNQIHTGRRIVRQGRLVPTLEVIADE